MQDQLKEYGLNFAQVMTLLILLLFPSVVALDFIEGFGLIEIGQNEDFFYICVAAISLYFVMVMFLHEKLISRLHDMVTLKYLVVILSFFWICYDGYMAYIFQKVYFQYQDLIVPRDIVWRDVEVLPDYVLYANLIPALKLNVSLFRFFVVILVFFKLIRGKEMEVQQTQKLRKKVRKKSLDDIKKNLHPSIMKQYENKDE